MQSNSSHLSENERLILVLADCNHGQVQKVTFEILSDARKIAAEIKGHVEVVLLTSPARSAGAERELRPYLREKLHIVEHPLLENYSTETYLEGLQTLSDIRAPRLLMLGATANGRDLGPRLAARFGMGYVPNCLTIKGSSGGKLDLTRVSHGGRVHVQSSWSDDAPLIITMRPGVADLPPKSDHPPAPVVARHRPVIHPGRVRSLEYRPADPKTQDLREAEAIVAGGHGVGGPEGFALIQGLADALGAAVGASRVAVDLGWIEYPRQVGQTGKTVAPKLYVAVGISGASHHLMGMRGSEKVIAVNTDKKAPIFTVSHFGVVGDLHELIPRLTKLIRKHKSDVRAVTEELEGVHV
jgi:electron transfer flavoprotein alpha subunit